MSRAKLSVVGWVVLASLMLVLGLTAWLAGASPFRTAQAAGLIDDAYADFAAGTGCYVRASGVGGLDGEVIVTSTVDTNFPGSTLPTGWSSSPVAAATVSGNQLIVDEGTVASGTAYAPQQTLEFSATISGPHAQFIGFSDNINFTNNYVIFGTTGANDGHLYARAVGRPDIDLGTGLLGVQHRFQIQWGGTAITYTVFTDTLGTSAAYVDSVAVAGPMNFMAFDGSSGTPLTVDWVRSWPWSCTYLSRVIDSGVDGTSFNGLSTTLNVPVNAAVSFEVITSTNNADWGAWTPVAADGTFISSTARYLQYHAILFAPDQLVTPEVQSVRVRGFGPPPTAVRLDSFSARPMDDAGQSWLIALSGFVLILGGGWLIGQRRRRFD